MKETQNETQNALATHLHVKAEQVWGVKIKREKKQLKTYLPNASS
jgi:hypothetical protein